ncbi:MAG TPA: hypothetical protein VGB52_14630 [Actinomycetota bacterium]
MNEYPVKLGSMLFTLVEPHREHVVAYNRWYERDHFYAGCLVGPGILSGARWVATRELKKLRYPADSPITADPMTGSYLATYFIEASQSREWGAWAAKEFQRLMDDGRMFEQRDHVHTQMYAFKGAGYTDPDGVPPELALDHRYPGLVALFLEANEGVSRGDVAGWFNMNLASHVFKRSSASLALSFSPIPIPGGTHDDIPKAGSGPRSLLYLWFCDANPADDWDVFAGLGEHVADGGFARVTFCSPFIPTIPGTDTYTDELW